MIDLKDGQLTDILPVQASHEPKIKALSKTLAVSGKRALATADRIKLRCAVDSAPDDVLDTLAAEDRAPYYEQTLPIETKRGILKRTLPWHYHAGTVSAVKELVQVAFQDGDVIEWWDFDDYESDPQPYMFDLVTGAAARTESRAFLMRVIGDVKSFRSHLRQLHYEHTACSALGISSHTHRVIVRDIDDIGGLTVLERTIDAPIGVSAHTHRVLVRSIGGDT